MLCTRHLFGSLKCSILARPTNCCQSSFFSTTAVYNTLKADSGNKIANMKLKKLTEEQRDAELPKLFTSGWKICSTRDALMKSFQFKTFNQAIGFMMQVALYAEKIDHHPEWANVYNVVDVTLTTHYYNALSNKDVLLANQIDSFATVYVN